MTCPYLKKYDTRILSGRCESPEGPLLEKMKRVTRKSPCEEYYAFCSYYREAQTDSSRFWQAFFSGK